MGIGKLLASLQNMPTANRLLARYRLTVAVDEAQQQFFASASTLPGKEPVMLFALAIFW
ncbi:MAG: hypothetical protein R2867_00205 [Caldilineaceae bacterium]